MKEYVDIVLKNSKKPIDIEKIYEKVESVIQKDNESYTITIEDKRKIDKIVERGLKRIEYYQTPTGKITPIFRTSFRKGRFHGNRAGEGFVTAIMSFTDKEGKKVVREEKYSILKNDCNNAVDGDLVLVDIGGNGIKPKIERILNRNLVNVIGEVIKVGDNYFVKPIDKKKQQLTILLDEECNEGDIVSVSLEEYNENNCYVGKILRVFTHKDDAYANQLLEAFKSGMPEGFSKESLEQLKTIPDTVRAVDYKDRVNLTKLNIISIDGESTKDKDDCISLSILPNGNYLLGVHIADVAYYVEKDSPIDKDAFRKGTSYYFGGLVEPQLPKKLSNGICSLNEGVERLTKSIFMEFDGEGNLVKKSLVPGIIKSRKSMTYENVNDLLEGKEVDQDYYKYESTLRKMYELSRILRNKRMLNNAINFDKPEIIFEYDSEGHAINYKLRNKGASESLIEEFMLAANSNVSELLTEKGITCIYRIHNIPSEERLREFLKLLDVLGYAFPYSVDDILEDKELMVLLTEHIKNKGKLDNMFSTNLIKCMSHASYNTSNIGHYGTGFDNYCHFTSPIRRLADLAISRIIDECYFEKDKEKRSKNIAKWEEVAIDYASQASKMERVEEEVEKSVDLYDTAVYMSSHIGEEFQGTVICISSNGLTIQLDNLLEGRVRTRNLNGDYTYDNSKFTLVSNSGDEDYYIGDRLKLRLVDVDISQKSVDFEVIEKIKENRIKNNQKVYKRQAI